jgi:hypothetical protein
MQQRYNSQTGNYEMTTPGAELRYNANTADITTQTRTIVNQRRIRRRRRKHHRPLTRRTLPINRTMGLNIPGNQRHWKANDALHRIAGMRKVAIAAIRLEVSQRHKSC